MRTVPVLPDHIAYVDDADFDRVMQHTWRKKVRHSHPYAAHVSSSEFTPSGKGKCIFMHRFILGLADPDVVVAHKDGNTLNNTRANIRPCTQMENAKNRAKSAGSTSRYKGVTLTPYNTWQVSAKANKNRFYLGTFSSEIEAALAYDAFVKVHHGEFARTNF